MRKTIYILLPLIVYSLAHDLVQFSLYMGINLLAGHGEQIGSSMQSMSSYMAAGVQVVSMLAGLGILILVLAFCKKKEFFPEIEAMAELESFIKKDETSGLHKTNNIADKEQKKYIIYMVSCTIIFMMLAASLNALFLQSPWVSKAGTFQETSKLQSGTPVVMAILLFGIVSPVVEEYLFRGLLFGRMKNCFSVPVSVMISALFFGIYHGNMVQGLYGFLTGLYLAFVLEQGINNLGHKKALLIPMVCHGAANLLVFFGGMLDWYTKMPLAAAVLLLIAALGLCGFTLTQRSTLH